MAERAERTKRPIEAFREDAPITVHFEKEEEISLPLLDARPDVAERVMMHIGAHHAPRLRSAE